MEISAKRPAMMLEYTLQGQPWNRNQEHIAPLRSRVDDTRTDGVRHHGRPSKSSYPFQVAMRDMSGSPSRPSRAPAPNNRDDSVDSASFSSTSRTCGLSVGVSAIFLGLAMVLICSPRGHSGTFQVVAGRSEARVRRAGRSCRRLRRGCPCDHQSGWRRGAKM
jgi:hypothetical protein